LFKFKPNPIMTTSEFLEKMTWLLFKNYNCFIYPAYDIAVDRQGRAYRRYTGFYPLNPLTATFLQDETERLVVEFDFGGGNKFTIPYDDVIHLRKKYSEHELLGGGKNGRPDNESLLRVLEVEHAILEGLEKAIPATLNVRGVLRVNTLIDDAKQAEERERFERAIKAGESGVLVTDSPALIALSKRSRSSAIKAGESGVLVTDLKAEYTPLEINPALVDKETMAFIQDKILNWVGVPLK